MNRRTAVFIVATFLMILLGPSPAICQTQLYVDGSVAASGNGQSWGTALKEVREALLIARQQSSVEEIHVAKGTYKPTAGSSRDSTFLITRGGLKIYGGYPVGGGTRNPVVNPTILSGNINSPTDSSDNSYHVVVAAGIPAGSDTMLLDGFTIYGGTANGAAGSSTNYNGQAIWKHEGAGIEFWGNGNDSKTVVRNCIIMNNGAQKGGGMEVVILGTSYVSIERSVFTGNVGVTEGASVVSWDARSIFQNCVFTGNRSPQSTVISSLSGSQVRMINCTIAGNSRSSSALTGVGLTVANSIIWNNGTFTNIVPTSPGIATVTYSIVQTTQNAYSGTGNLMTDPLFFNEMVPAGADGVWGTADDGFRLYAQTSPAANAGSNNPITAANPIDITGAARIQNTVVDMGAYEGWMNTCPALTIIYVDSSMTASGNGTSWATAYKTLSEALTAASYCPTEIWVRKGTYYPGAYPLRTTGATSRDYAFGLRNNLAIYGGFAGTEAATSERVGGNNTILSGDMGIPNNAADNCYHVLISANCNTTAILDGVIVRNGNANATTGDINSGLYYFSRFNGGGLSNTYSSPLIQNCVFLSNNSYNAGGAMDNYGSSPTVVNSLFVGNSCNNVGGAIDNYELCYPKFVNCNIYGNNASNAGAIYNYRSGVYIYNTIVWGNTATVTEPGIVNIDGWVSSAYSNLQGNSTYGDAQTITTDPLFVNAADPVGPDGQWGTTDDGLQPGFCSPVIGKAYSNLYTITPGIDFTRRSRIVSVMDIGPYEKQTAKPAVLSNLAALSTIANSNQPLSRSCEDGGWTYYSIPGNADSVCFSIFWNGNTVARNVALVSIGVEPANTDQSGAGAGTWAMRRFWNVNLNGETLTAPVKVRFYYAAADTVAMHQSAAASGITPISRVKWFKTTNTPYSPTLITPTTITSGFTMLRTSGSGSVNNIAWIEFDSLTSFSGGTAMVNAGASVALPVSFMDFNVQRLSGQDGNLLRWNVGVEQDVKTYEVQRAHDGSNFSTIGIVAATNSHEYSFTDETPLPGKNYYRLTLMGNNGSNEYSIVRMLTNHPDHGMLAISPNPVKDVITIRITAAQLAGTEASIVDITGRIVKRIQLSQVSSVDVKEWTPGFYLLRLANGGVVRFMKQ